MPTIGFIGRALPLCLLGLAPTALAQRGDPGSLLLFAEYNSTPGTLNLITVTNIADPPAAPTRTRWAYVDGSTCFQFDNLEILTANDTLTVVASAHNSVPSQGYLYVYAENGAGDAIVHNQLIGTSTIIDGVGGESYTIEPFSFVGLAGNYPGAPTDVNGNNRRDLNGIEYSRVGDEYLFPRFIGQSATYDSQLILLDLSGGGAYTTFADLLFLNDNEELFSTETSFVCWTKVSLSTVSVAFTNAFLQGFTNHDPNEILGSPALESGWMRFISGTSIETRGSNMIQDPAIIPLLIETESSGTACSSHPVFVGQQSNASLLPDGSTLSPLGGE